MMAAAIRKKPARVFLACLAGWMSLVLWVPAVIAAVMPQQVEDQPAPEEKKPEEEKPAESQKPNAAQAEPTAAQRSAQQVAEDVAQGRGAVDRRTQQPPRDQSAKNRIKDILNKLDPATFNSLIGAEIEVEVVGGQVIIQGPAEAVKKLEMLIRLIDESKPRKEVEVVTVTKRDAKEIATSLEPVLRQQLREPNQAPEDELSIKAVSQNLLLVSALPKHLDFIISVIEQIDEMEDPLGPIEQLVFPLQHRRATEVAEQLKKILQQLRQKVGASGAKAELQVIANTANNSIMIIAPESEREKLAKLVAEIDVSPAKGWGEVKLTLYPLLHSKASELAEVVTKLLAAQGGTGAADKKAAEELIKRLIISKALPSGEVIELPPIDLEKPTKIIADAGTNSLIVATVEENTAPMGELIRLLDGVPLGVDIGIKIFPLRFADAKSVEETLKALFEEGKDLPKDPDGSGEGAVPEGVLGKALVYDVGIKADERTNTLIVSGRSEQLALVENIVNELDRPVTSLKFPLRLFPLSHTDAGTMAALLKDLFEKRMESLEASGADAFAKEREKIYLGLDMASNALIVSASEENFVEVEAILRQLDRKPITGLESVRIIQCRTLLAKDMKEKIDELWERKTSIRGELEMPEDKPVIAIDERSNVLIVASSVGDFEEIRRLIDALESQPRVDDIQLFKLEYADATVLKGMLEELFKGVEAQIEGFKAPTIMPDQRGNAIVAAGTRDALDRLKDVIARLDVKAGPTTAVFKVYPLQHASASKLAPRMQELFDNRGEGEDVKRTPIVIIPDEASNSVIASASRDDHEVVVDLIGLLDKPSSLARQFEIFPLKTAKAAGVAESLENLFKSQGEGGTGRADAISTVADERTNSIIVWASPSEMVNIRDVISRLDTSAPTVDMMIKVVQLKQALAEDFAKLLEEVLLGEGAEGDDQRAVIVSFLEKDDRGKETVRRLLRQDIKIKPDPRTNSLMIMAPADSVAMLEAMIKDFDRIRPITSEIRLFTLVNSDAETMVERLNELFKPTEGGGEGETKTQLVFGDSFQDLDLATVGQELRFAADRRTNTLIVAGSPVYLTMVEDLVTYLDAQEAEDRAIEVIHARYKPASELADAIKGFTDQEIAVLGEGDDEESRQRRQERQVSVQAIGDEEKGSSSLVVGTSRRAYQRTMQMLEELDSPEPQVMINVLIAEVSLNDRSELGVEIAGQDLAFSESAVVGPNGIIQGGDFDYVLGTTLGAIGTGQGFNFTLNGEDLSFLLHALQSNSRLEVLSRPIIMVRNGEEGKVTIADQVPVVESTRFSDSGEPVSTVGREEVGIVLTATPHISPDGYVTIELEQEISNITGENIQLTEGLSSPIFAERKVQTNVTVRDGETVVIGGLIQTRKSEGETKMPILGDLPIIGPLLRSTTVTNARTELMLVMTVDVLRNDKEVREMSLAQRDRYGLPDTILKNPLMEKLRIAPGESGMGPVDADVPPAHGAPPASAAPAPHEPNGDTPKYGPSVPRVKPTSTASAPVYGPVIAKKPNASLSKP